MLSRKHYIALAAIVRAPREVSCSDAAAPVIEHTTDGIALALADYCKQDNSNFDRARFLEACGLVQS